MSIDIHHWGIDQFRDAYRDGASVGEVVDAALALVRALPAAVLIGPPLEARARADAAALTGVDPASLALYGVPFVVKDNIDVAGEPTTAGCPGYAYVADADATLVERLRAAGAIVVGKTNLDQFATGLVGTRSPYGTPRNALRAELVPGGSSSGSAVAVALGAVPFAIGSDTAGSGRVPAALNGLIALKPTLGRVSMAGIVPAVRRLDCPAVFSRSTADARDVADVIAGPDRADPYSRAPWPTRPMRWPPVIGVPDPWPDDVALDVSMRDWFDASVKRMIGLGATVVGVDVAAALELGAMLYGSAMVGERAAAVGDAIASGIDGLDPTVAAIITESSRATAVEAYRAEYRLAELRAACAEMWTTIDVLALPTTPNLPTLAQVRDDPIGVNRTVGQLTTFVNLADAACVVVPMEPGVPGGLQLVAAAWHDDELLRLGDSYLRGELAPPAPSMTIVVVGAHLDGLPLNGQLTSRGAWMRERTTTAPTYRLYELAGTVPRKPGLQRVAEGGAAIEVEVWSIGPTEFGSFVDGVPAPLGIGTVELADGTWHHGLISEGWA
ncbi:MAG: atzF, partial [Ilumatobacteraceae bacterium]|nr:atzF [Ilumatobacteraceae bacterium]